MATKKKALQAAAGNAGGDLLAIEDVFSTYLYTGNGSTQTITNGIDLAGEGGLVWIKPRVLSDRHLFVDTERGSDRVLASNNTNAEIIATNPSFQPIESFNSNGFTVGAFNDANDSGDPHASWTFRKAPRFFDVVTYTGNWTSGTQIAHNLGVTPGCIIVKSLSEVRNWFVYHRSLGATKHLHINTTDAEAVQTDIWNNTEPTDTHFTLGDSSDVNSGAGGGQPYVAYLFAHDPLGPSGDGSDGLIACGSFSGEQEIDLGWEAGWVLTKGADTATDWYIQDNMRGLHVDTLGKALNPNTSAAEINSSLSRVSATGFKTSSGWAGVTGIYIAIRRGPMRQPTSGTEVFNTITRTGNGTTTSVTGVGFPPDLFISRPRTGTSGLNSVVVDRIRGAKIALSTRGTFAEQTENDGVTVIGQDGVTVGASQAGFFNGTNYPSDTLAYWNFRRAPGFFDVVAYSGDSVAGRTVPHNLGVAPELMIVKGRTNVQNWPVYAEPLGNSTVAFLNLSNAVFTGQDHWNSTTPTSSVFSLGDTSAANQSGQTYIAYLFATLPGVSKVGSYTGNGTSQTINCGFTTGARFVLIKRTDASGDWYVWDTARGIVAANDPHLSLNTTVAEVTTDDSIDPDSSGFIVNQVAATNINVSSASYIFMAIS